MSSLQTFPKSAFEQAGGMVYFPRMLDKIRLHSQQQLPPAYHDHLGKGADSRCCNFLRVSYSDLQARVLAGGLDADILQWCFANGRALDANDLKIWNGYISKLGWRDAVSPYLEKVKTENGLAQRNDILTMFELFDVDEGREP